MTYTEIRRKKLNSKPGGFIIEIAIVQEIGNGRTDLLKLLSENEIEELEDGYPVIIQVEDTRSEHIEHIIDRQ